VVGRDLASRRGWSPPGAGAPAAIGSAEAQEEGQQDG
jgi:hypothetical protein